MRHLLVVGLILGCTGCGWPESHIPDFVSELPLCVHARQERYSGPFSTRDCAIYFGGMNGFSNVGTMLHVKFSTGSDGRGSVVVDRYSGSSDSVDRGFLAEEGLLAFDYPLSLRGGFADFYPLTRSDGVPVLSVWVYGSEENPRAHAGDVPAGAITNLEGEVYAVTSDHAPGPWTAHVFEVVNQRIVEIGTVDAHWSDQAHAACVIEAVEDIHRNGLDSSELALLCSGFELDDQSPRMYRDASLPRPANTPTDR